ncbi:hypothetical protein THRCLA_03911 [Thraustotheca clavata]|uniref:Uncharacterized protein n=1 Tax=Thraustotheca clavata TaxID=74557 RepID=A0A1W0A192_9STRA|nr:hypothetical protein THRCLA_03911 [Thraustotheca clavata]
MPDTFFSLPKNHNILPLAAACGNHDVVQAILDELNYKLLPKYAYSPICQVVTFNHKHTVQVLLEKMSDVCFSGKDINETESILLHFAINNKANEILELLLNHGTPSTVYVLKVSEGLTPLHEAAIRGNVIGVIVLLKYGAYVNQQSPICVLNVNFVLCFKL